MPPDPMRVHGRLRHAWVLTPGRRLRPASTKRRFRESRAGLRIPNRHREVLPPCRPCLRGWSVHNADSLQQPGITSCVNHAQAGLLACLSDAGPVPCRDRPKERAHRTVRQGMPRRQERSCVRHVALGSPGTGKCAPCGARERNPDGRPMPRSKFIRRGNCPGTVATMPSP